jgi:agmatinase
MSKVDLNLSMQSVPSFFGAPIGDIEDLSEKKIAVAGLFCDHFSQGEPGARYAARQLRYASTPLLANGLKISTPSNIIDVGELNGFNKPVLDFSHWVETIASFLLWYLGS